MKILSGFVSGFGALAVSIGAAAQVEPVEAQAPPVEVSAFRIPLLVTETAQGVTVVTSSEIETRNAGSTAEILQMVPGVQVDRIGGPGGTSSIYIRGSDPEHVLVLVDGVRMNDPLLSRGGAYDLSAIDPATIERIEVIRGAGSAIYGADAIGGIVNIVTKGAAREGTQVSGSVSAGTKGYGNGSARVAGNTGQAKFSLGAAALQDGEEEDGSDLKLTTMDGSVSWQATTATEVKAFARRNDRESSAFPDSSGGIRLASNRTLEQREADESTLGGALAYRPGDQWGINVQVSRYSREEDIDSPGVDPGPGAPFGIPATVSHTELTRDVALLSGSLRLPANSDLTLGHEWQREDGDSRSTQAFLPPGDFSLDRYTHSTFAAAKSKPVENLVVLLDLRYDRISSLESETSPGVGVRYDFAHTGTALKARYSEGFRPPSFFSLASPLVGNPNLSSETSRSYELGAEQSFGAAVQAGASRFWTRTRNLIDFDPTVPGPIGFGQIVNRDTVDSQGVETYITFKPLRRLDAGVNYTYVTTEIVQTGAELRNRPKHRASLSLGYQLDGASRLTWSTVYVGSSLDFSVPTDQIRLSDYTRSDVGYSYKWKQFSATAAVDNLFDDDYEEFVGFTNPGRRFRVGLSAVF
jgi:outer membrane cobalamin receptor